MFVHNNTQAIHRRLLQPSLNSITDDPTCVKTKASLSVVFFITFFFISSPSSSLCAAFTRLFSASALFSHRRNIIRINSTSKLTSNHHLWPASIDRARRAAAVARNFVAYKNNKNLRRRLQEEFSRLAYPCCCLFARIREGISYVGHDISLLRQQNEGDGGREGKKSQNSNINVTNSSRILPVALLFYMCFIYLHRLTLELHTLPSFVATITWYLSGWIDFFFISILPLTKNWNCY